MPRIHLTELAAEGVFIFEIDPSFLCVFRFDWEQKSEKRGKPYKIFFFFSYLPMNEWDSLDLEASLASEMSKNPRHYNMNFLLDEYSAGIFKWSESYEMCLRDFQSMTIWQTAANDPTKAPIEAHRQPKRRRSATKISAHKNGKAEKSVAAISVAAALVVDVSLCSSQKHLVSIDSTISIRLFVCESAIQATRRLWNLYEPERKRNEEEKSAAKLHAYGVACEKGSGEDQHISRSLCIQNVISHREAMDMSYENKISINYRRNYFNLHAIPHPPRSLRLRCDVGKFSASACCPREARRIFLRWSRAGVAGRAAARGRGKHFEITNWTAKQ